jgi:iron complex outermembrane recepter protein
MKRLANAVCRYGAVGGALLIPGAAALAQEIAEVVVTAEKRAQNIQDVPISISAVSEDTINKLGMTSFRDWADYVPGITMSYGLNSRRGGPIAVIRGITNQVRGGIDDSTANATTAYTIGEIPVFSVSPNLPDMQRIEVLKGPQGTLYGIAAMGGVVRYIPNYAQTDNFSGRIEGGGGLINKGGGVMNANGMVNIPVIKDVLAVRLTADYEYNGGFIDHIFPPLSDARPLVLSNRVFDPRTQVDGHYLKDSNQTTSKGGRVAVTFTPNDKLTMRGLYIEERTDSKDSGQMDVNDPLDLVINRYILQPQSEGYKLASLEVGYDLGFGSIHYITGHYENDLSETVDATAFVAQQLVPLKGDTFYPTAVAFPFTTHTHQGTHELRLQGDNEPLGLRLFGNELRFDYTIGAFYQSETRAGGYNLSSPEWNHLKGPNTQAILTDGGLILGATGIGVYTNKAGFFDVTLHVTPRLSLGGGLRWFDQKKVSDGRGYGGTGPPPFADDLSNPDFYANGRSRGGPSEVRSKGSTPRMTANFKLDAERMLYFTAANGQRIGATAPLATAPIIQPPECETLMRQLGLYDPFVNGTKSDKVWSYDLGLKSTWLDKHLLLNVSVYQNNWTDLQQVVILNSIDRNCSQVIQANVGAARIRGFEVETVYSPTHNLKFNASTAFADARIVDAPPGVRDSIGMPLKKGDLIQGVPKVTGNIGGEYDHAIGEIMEMPMDSTAFARVDWRYVSERINGFGDRQQLETLLPFNVARAYRLTDVRVGVENDSWSIQAYVSNVFDERAEFESLGNYFQPHIQEVAVSQPRTMGLSFTKNF